MKSLLIVSLSMLGMGCSQPVQPSYDYSGKWIGRIFTDSTGPVYSWSDTMWFTSSKVTIIQPKVTDSADGHHGWIGTYFDSTIIIKTLGDSAYGGVASYVSNGLWDWYILRGDTVIDWRGGTAGGITQPSGEEFKRHWQ